MLGMRFEDAGCENPCGLEPMGCTNCEEVVGISIDRYRGMITDYIDNLEEDEDELDLP